jgi:phage gp36-like protein
MKFLKHEDIRSQCSAEDLDVLSQSSDKNLDDSEEKTISVFEGFLSRYDLEKVFAPKTGATDTRNKALIMYMVDHLLYILYSAQPDRLIPDMRVKRYDDTISWLKGIQKGDISPAFPTVDSEEETDINSGFRCGSNTRVSGSW